MGFWTWLVGMVSVPVGVVGVLLVGQGLVRGARRPGGRQRALAANPGSWVDTGFLFHASDTSDRGLESATDGCNDSGADSGGGGCDGGGGDGGGDGGGGD